MGHSGIAMINSGAMRRGEGDRREVAPGGVGTDI